MSDLRVFDALLRHDFRAFLEKCFLKLSPGSMFTPDWAIEAMAWQLERVRRGELRRLIINAPPRSLKSITGSVVFPAFCLGHDPTQRFICVSYSAELAKKHSNDFRAILEESWYRRLFPGTRIGHFKNSETEVELTGRGFRLATSVGGTLTGRGGDIVVIDDPLKPDDALSEPRRMAVNQWFTNTLLSRLDDKRTGAIVVIMQRVHTDDLTGFLRDTSEVWEVLSLPAIAEVAENVPLFGGRSHHRAVGEVLSPEREPLDILEGLKRELGSALFSAQYQQAPVPPGGAMVKREWVKRFTERPPKSGIRMVLQSWDTASKGGPENDWSVCTTWLIGRDQRRYLVDLWRGRVDYPTLKAKVRDLSETWGVHRVLVEEVGAGISLVQELKREVNGIVGVVPDRDKVSRMAVASAKFEAGQALLPERAPWLADLEAELFAFPGVRHDDQCDSISQALMDEARPRLVVTQEILDSVERYTTVYGLGGQRW